MTNKSFMTLTEVLEQYLNTNLEVLRFCDYASEDIEFYKNQKIAPFSGWSDNLMILLMFDFNKLPNNEMTHMFIDNFIDNFEKSISHNQEGDKKIIKDFVECTGGLTDFIKLVETKTIKICVKDELLENIYISY